MTLSIDAVDKIAPGRRGAPVHAVCALDLDVVDGELIALLGSAGCGKISTLRFGLAEGERGVGRPEAARRVREMADMLEIGPILDRRPSSLSGEQQRASLARALARDADLHLRARVKAALRVRGLTAVLVTHDQKEADAMADRIAVMEVGIRQQYGKPDELREAPVICSWSPSSASRR